MVHAGEGLVDRRRRQAPFDLHMALVVAGREIPRTRREQRLADAGVTHLQP